MTGYPSKKKAASAKTIDEVNWADYEQAIEPNTITFHNLNSDWVMRITADRRIEVNEDVEVTEAAQKVLDALQNLLKPAQPEQEPVAFVKGCNRGQWEIFPAKAYQIFEKEQPLYTTPPQRTWVGLTDELLEALEEIAYGLEGARIWGGMEWVYNPLHPHKYLPLRDKARAATAKATGEHPPQRKPLTDEQRKDLMNKAWDKWLSGKDDNHLFAWHFSFEVEAAHDIKE